MTASVRGKTLSRSFMLLWLSAAMLLVCVQRQAAASVPTTGVETSSEAQPEMELAPFWEAEFPARETPSEYFPLEELFPASTSQDTRLVIKLRDRRVYVYQGDLLQASYPIAVGKAGWETPKGNYTVIQMLRDPAWEHPWTGKVIPPGPDNPLGARWIGFWTDGHNFIGFHGTPNEELVGQAVSHGCIRMRNRDILALYGQVEIGTPVTVEP